MNGDTQQVPGEGNWQYKPDDKGVDAQPMASIPPPPAPVQNAATQTPEQPQAPAEPSSLPPAPVMADPQPELPPQPDVSVDWTASEYIAHDKSVTWFLALIGGTVVLALLVFFLTHDIISVGLVGIVALYMGILANRKPRVLDYHVDNHGITIEGKFYPFGDFRSFGVLQEGAFSSIVFTPMKRFMPPLSIYYPPEQQNDIADAISMYLPFEPVRFDAMDSILHRIRF